MLTPLRTWRGWLLATAAATVAIGFDAAAQRSTPAPAAAPGGPARPAARAQARRHSQRPPASTPARPSPVPAHAATPLSAAAQTELVTTYCATCHSDRAKAGGLSLAGFTAMKAQEQPEVVEKMIRKLRAGMMPPAGAKRPDGPTVAALTASLESRMDERAAVDPNPGWRPFQRLNRAEYARAVKDLLGLDVDVTAFLPPDTISHGFDNVADVQDLSPTLMEGYLRAASQISRLAVGDRDATPAAVTYKVGRTMSQMRHVEGAPIGTRGGISVTHVFPADGEYVIGVNLHNEPLGGLYGRTTMSVMELDEQLDVSIDGERVAVIPLNERMSESDRTNSLDPRTARVYVKAGPHRVSAAFIQRFEAPPNDLLIPVENTLADVSMSFGVTLLPHLRDMSVHGPYSVTGVSDTVSRRLIFTCRPTSAAEEPACASRIIASLAARAFRGPVPPADLEALMGFYTSARKKGDFEAAIRYALQAILASPRFAFRLEEVPSTVRAGQAYRLGDQDLAARLSFFLWGTMPDDVLVKAAAAGQPAHAGGTQPAGDADARRPAVGSAGHPVRRAVAAAAGPRQDHPRLPAVPALRRHAGGGPAARDRAVRGQPARARTAACSTCSTPTTPSSTSASPSTTGSPTSPAASSAGSRSPIPTAAASSATAASWPSPRSPTAPRRCCAASGSWRCCSGRRRPRRRPTCRPLDDVKDVKGGRTLSVRERMEQHRANPACTSCHKVIDPLGLALENFDVTGAWRIRDNEVAVDPVGVLYDGTKLDGPVALRSALKAHADAVLLSFTEALMTYATGRRVEPFDMPAIRRIIRDAAASNYTVTAFVQGVVASQAFRMSRSELPEAPHHGGRETLSEDRHI